MIDPQKKIQSNEEPGMEQPELSWTIFFEIIIWEIEINRHCR